MKQTPIIIDTIPAMLWGEPSKHRILAVHGSQSHKADTVIALLAQEAVERGYQVVSFDLPEHGDRKEEPTRCKVQPCIEELRTVMEYTKRGADEISLFGCSLGAYFSLMAFSDEPLAQALFLSPVVNMERLIQNMMKWFSVSEERLAAEREIATPIGEILDWEYYCYVREHPITHWKAPTEILYGAADSLCEREVVSSFAARFGCRMTVQEQGEHFFHTPEQLSFYQNWLKNRLAQIPQKEESEK